MMISRDTAKRMLGYACVTAGALALLSGCEGMHGEVKDKPSAQTIVTTEPELSPAEVEQRYHRAYAEGVQHVAKGQYGLALGAFQEAVAMKPASTEALFNLGACHEALGDPLQAIKHYRAVLELTPDDADCYANLGTSYIKLYHQQNSPAWRKMALEAWRQALELNPEQPRIRQYMQMAEAEF